MENEKIKENLLTKFDFIDLFYFMSFNGISFYSDEISNNLCSFTLLNYYGPFKDKTIIGTSLNSIYRKAVWFLIKEGKLNGDKLWQ